MTENDLKRFINELNKNNAEEYIFLRPLTTAVDFATVWDHTIHPLTKVKSLLPPNSFYFIKNADGYYVAAVSDMSYDLHWFVLPKYRGKGYLTNSLKSVILPHLFQDNRSEQRITIDKSTIGEKNYSASLKVAKALGFIQTSNWAGKTELKISNSDFTGLPYIAGKNTTIPEERIKIIIARAKEIGKELFKIESELEMKIGFPDEIEEIKEIAVKVKRVPDLIHDVYWVKK